MYHLIWIVPAFGKDTIYFDTYAQVAKKTTKYNTFVGAFEW